MHNIDDINSILNAVDEINLKPKKKSLNVDSVKNSIPNLNHDLKIAPDIDRLITEAEQFKKNSVSKPAQIVVAQRENDKIKLKNYNNTLKEVQALVIEDLYSKFSKKIKKNTLKIIFNLHMEIKNLENKLKNFQSHKDKTVDAKQTIEKNTTFIDLNNKDILKKEIITSLSIQDASIEILNTKILNFKKTEEELRLRIIDLEQDKTLLLKEQKKSNELQDYKNKLSYTKIKLQSIYKQIEKQKTIFINLNNYLIKIEQNSSFFKENYERLVVENTDIKKKLVISKEQIVAHESNKHDLLQSINQLNEILSKTNASTKISSLKQASEENTLIKKQKE